MDVITTRVIVKNLHEKVLLDTQLKEYTQVEDRNRHIDRVTREITSSFHERRYADLPAMSDHVEKIELQINPQRCDMCQRWACEYGIVHELRPSRDLDTEFVLNGTCISMCQKHLDVLYYLYSFNDFSLNCLICNRQWFSCSSISALRRTSAICKSCTRTKHI